MKTERGSVQTPFGVLPTGPFRPEELTDEQADTLAQMFAASEAHAAEDAARMAARGGLAQAIQRGKERYRAAHGLTDPEHE